MRQRSLVLGVDGGATKSEIAIADMRGRIVAIREAGPASFNTMPAHEVCKTIAAGILPLLRKLKLGKTFHFARACLGIAGIDAKEDMAQYRPQVLKYFHQLIPQQTVLVNDVVVALYAGAPSGNGIALIAGTGSNCYGHDPSGNEAYAGGLAGTDEGSGYDIGIQLLRAAAKSFDGRGQKTSLERLLCARYHAGSVREVTPLIRRAGWSKREIASLAPMVDQAARSGDEVAKDILRKSAEELADMVKAVAERLVWKNARYEVVLVGSVLKKSNYLYNTFNKIIKSHLPQARTSLVRGKPVKGAIRRALANIS